jgi:hypothetical protein
VRPVDAIFRQFEAHLGRSLTPEEKYLLALGFAVDLDLIGERGRRAERDSAIELAQAG